MASVNERLAVLDGWSRYGTGMYVQTIPGSFKKLHSGPPDILNDWNALKRLEAKAMNKSSHAYVEALFKARMAGHSSNWMLTVAVVLHATPEQVAEAILAVLEN